MRKSLFIVFFLLPTVIASAQSFYAVRRERNLIVNAGTGASRYFGELVNPGRLGKVRMNITGGLEYHLTGRISARADVLWFQLSGSDQLATAESNRRPRNLSFFSNNFEADALISVSAFKNDSKKFYQRSWINPYAFAGIGLLHFNPKTYYQGEVVALQPLQTEGVKYSRQQFVIPFGFGVSFKVSPWMNIALEGVYRETFTDYLDDISVHTYPDASTLSSPLAVALSDRRRELDPNYDTDRFRDVRGNPENQDSYAVLTAKIQFYVPTSFGSGKKLYNTKRKATKKTGGMYKVKKRALKPHAPKRR
jgi:hypothetical protein